jgi:DNA repair protein RecO (recombination protein O)
MEWTDEGIVLGVRRHGESSAIVELLTRSHGRHLGLVRGGSGSRMRPLLQPGNSVTAVWRARLDEHLGTYALEGTRLRAATVLASSHAVYGVTHLSALARLLPERDPHEDIYDMLERTLNDFDDIGEAAVHLVKFELAMLAELGFGLDLENCAATGATTELIYVSPKSGCCGCRVFCVKAAAAPTAGPTRICRTAFSLPACSCCATCWSRADRAIPTPATASSTR